MPDFIMEIINSINGVLWGWLISGILLLTGIFFTIKLGAPQILHFPKLFSNIKRSMKAEGGLVSGFGVLCAALGSLIGTGTLVGTATAIAAGGPGAIFWMWVVAFISMPLALSETIMGQVYRSKGSDGTNHGGTAYYIAKGLKKPKLAALYSICMIISIGFFYAMLQSNSITNATVGVMNVEPLYVGIVVLILTALVVVGGLKRFADVATFLVPFMALAYILCALFIVIINFDKIPAVFAMIIEAAFSGQAATGGVIGYSIQQAFRHGVARGMFSNDAGTGVAAGMHSGANVKHPVEQGFAAMFGIFVVTVVICSSTAFVILFADVQNSGLSGINLTQEAFVHTLGEAGRWIIAIAMFLFAYTSLLSDVYLGETNLKYLFKDNAETSIWIFRVACAFIIIVGSLTSLNTVWAFVDLTVASLIFINLFALLSLRKQIVYVFKDYFTQLKNGVERPEWDYNAHADMNGIDVDKK